MPPSFYRIGAVASHQTVLLRRAPGPLLTYTVMPILLTILLTPAAFRLAPGLERLLARLPLLRRLLAVTPWVIGEHDAFGEHLRNHAAAAGPNGGAYGDLPLPRCRPRHRQVGDIGTGNQQYERHRRVQHQQRSFGAREK